MARRRNLDTTERTRRRYSSGRRGRTAGVDEDSVIERTDDLDDDLDFDIDVDDEAIIYAGQDLEEASLEELREFADELQIDDYEDMNRATLMREIRDRI